MPKKVAIKKTYLPDPNHSSNGIIVLPVPKKPKVIDLGYGVGSPKRLDRVVTVIKK